MGLNLFIFNVSLMLRASDVTQTAKSARSQENAASSGRFGNLRYAGSRNINVSLKTRHSVSVGFLRSLRCLLFNF
jgi:hypothetical protein